MWGIGESWPELLSALFQSSQSNDASHREGAFRIFATTPGIINKQHADIVQGVFAKGFKDADINVGALLTSLATFCLIADRYEFLLWKHSHPFSEQ